MHSLIRTQMRLPGFITLLLSFALGLSSGSMARSQSPSLSIHWDKVTVVSRSIPTLQVVVNPRLRPGEPLSAASYKAVKDLGADYVRYVPWLPYPKLAVAELEPPHPRRRVGTSASLTP